MKRGRGIRGISGVGRLLFGAVSIIIVFFIAVFRGLKAFFAKLYDIFRNFFYWLKYEILPFILWMLLPVGRFFRLIADALKWFFSLVFGFFARLLGPVLRPVKRFFIRLMIPVYRLIAPWIAWVKLKLGIREKQPIENALADLKREIVFLDIFNIILNSAIGFLAGLMLAIIFNFSWEYAFVPAAAVLGYFSYMYFTQRKLLIVEGKVPELSEKLRTAADNVGKSNEITEGLKSDVVHEMKKVHTTFFIDVEGVGVRLFSIAMIAFIVVILSFLDLTFDFQFSPAIQNPAKYIRERVFSQDVGPNATMDFTEGNLSNAFGNRTALILLGDEKIELQVNPLQSELSFDDVQEAEQRNFNPPVYPKEIYTSYDASYTEKIAKKNQQVVKSYFEQIATQ